MIAKTLHCQTCYENIKMRGEQVKTLYELICNYYTAYAAVCLELKNDGTLEILLQYLEQSGYVVTSEANHLSMIFVKPCGHATFDDEGCITTYCSKPHLH
jgi:hypothetical protein